MDDHRPESSPSRFDRLKPAIKPAIIIVSSLLVGWITIGFIGKTDWAAVGSAFQQISFGQVLILLALLFVRQLLNAIPLAKFLPGLGIGRSLQNDVAANLSGTLAPPPADVVLRVSMFRSWNLSPVDGMAAVTLNMITFYSVRFFAPALGLGFISADEFDHGKVVLATIMGVAAAAIIITLLLVLRADNLAALLGRSAARVVARFRSNTDQTAWSNAAVDFRGRTAGTVRDGLAVSMLGMFGMVLADVMILALALRFAGVSSEGLPWWNILGSFLVAYPLTTLPLFGLGVLDASLLAAWTVIAGVPLEAEILAGLVIWRAITILGPLLMGVASMVAWKRRYGASLAAAEAAESADGPTDGPDGSEQENGGPPVV
jgi:putative heme transporter